MSRPTLSGAIPGLLRRGSPVISTVDGTRGVLCHHDEPATGCTPSPMGWFVADLDAETVSVWRYDEVALDLTHPTGRAHAAWWLGEQDEDVVNEAIEAHVYSANLGADVLGSSWVSGRDLTPAQVEALRLVVEQVAREVSRG